MKNTEFQFLYFMPKGRKAWILDAFGLLFLLAGRSCARDGTACLSPRWHCVQAGE